MNKIYKILGVSTCLAIFCISCETVDYGDVNVNPNGPTAAVSSQLFTTALSQMPEILVDETPILYMQHITQGQYPGASRYNQLSFNYDNWYAYNGENTDTGALQNLNFVIKLNTDEETSESASAYGSVKR